MTLIYLIISLLDLYSKLLIAFILINALTYAGIFNDKSTILKKINAVLLLLFTAPIKLVKKHCPHIARNIDFSPVILLLILWVLQYILHLMI